MMLNKNFTGRKGRAPGVKKCFALNTSGGYIWEGLTSKTQYSSLCSLGSTCTETKRVDMILSIVIIMGIYALIIGLLIMWDKEKTK